MDISKNMQTKLSFGSEVYQQLSQQLSVLDTFKGSWKVKENQQGQYLKELRKIATIESTGSSTRIEGAKHASDSEIGIDAGIKCFADFSDGTLVEGVHSFRKHEERLAREQRTGKSRKEKYQSFIIR